MAMKKSKMATKKKMAYGKKTKMAMKAGKKTTVRSPNDKMAKRKVRKPTTTTTKMAGGKKTKMAAKSTTARGSGAARPQKFRKNG